MNKRILWAVGGFVATALPSVSRAGNDVEGDSVRIRQEMRVVDMDSARHRFRLVKWIGNYLNNTNKRSDRPFDFSILAGPSYTASTSVGIGGTASGLYSWDRTDSLLPKSNVSVFLNASLTGMLSVGVKGNNFLPRQRYRFNYQLYLQNFPGKFWGVGYDNGADGSNEGDYKRIKVQFKPDFLFRVTPRLYLGMVGDIQWINSFGFDRPDLLEGRDHTVFARGLGLNVTYDSRDFVLNAYRGNYFCLEQMFYPSGFGNKEAFSYTDLTYAAYRQVWKGGVLAMELHSLFNYGDVPWTMLAQVGVQGRMRGYYEGRYRDQNILEGQVELRQRIHGRYGMAVWVGAANVFPDFKNIYFRQILPNYGIGYRWEFKKRVNIRMDLGFTKDKPNFTFNINEAF
ncbi:MAG: BamA/TamA family outer membrane protein [Clostridium sp.]|nr:BamA/TamA family outer membrane protein [Clostridium sp.]